MFAIYNRLSPRGREYFPAVILAFRAPTASAKAAQVIEQAQCPLLALSGHALVHCKCPLSGVKRTCLLALHMSAYDPKRTSLDVRS